MPFDKESGQFLTDSEWRIKLKEEKRRKNREAWAKREDKRVAVKAISAPLTSEANKERVQEFKRMLLHAPIGESVIRKVIDIARNDEHPGQMVAIKICMDRLLPVSLFEDKKEGGRASIEIKISGIGEEKTVGEVIDNE